MSDYLKESAILEMMKKRRQCESTYNEESDENEDRLSDLPDGVILHILSFLNTKHVVRTCVLSTRWKHLWKCISTLILHSSTFSTVKQFAIFVSNILTLRDSSTALRALDVHRMGNIEPQLLKKILNYVSSHNTHLHELGISVRGDSSLIMRCVSSCHALTSLKLSLYPRGSTHTHSYTKTLFTKSLNFPLLTTLELENFAFCGCENRCAEPFSTFTKLNRLVISSCEIKDAQILSISNETLVNLALHDNSLDFAKIELSTPSLCTFTFTGDLIQKICGSSLSSIKQANIDAQDVIYPGDSALVLLSLLQDLASVESLAVTSTTLQILSLVPDLLEVKLPSLCNLKSLEVELIPLQYGYLDQSIKDAMFKKAAAKSHKEVGKLVKAFKAGLKPPPIPDGIVDFLRQNSLSAEVNITTDYLSYLNLKQVVESVKGAKIINSCSPFSDPPSSSASPAWAAESASAPASAASPPNLLFCSSEKDDKSSNEDKMEKHQPYSNCPLVDNEQ